MSPGTEDICSSLSLAAELSDSLSPQKHSREKTCATFTIHIELSGRNFPLLGHFTQKKNPSDFKFF